MVGAKIISTIKWIQTCSLSIKNCLSGEGGWHGDQDKMGEPLRDRDGERGRGRERKREREGERVREREREGERRRECLRENKRER